MSSRDLNPASETPVQPGRTAHNLTYTELRRKGKSITVPSVQIDGKTVISTGSWCKIAVVRDEELIEGDTITAPDSFICQLKKSGLKADIFTFAQRLPDKNPKYAYYIEWENAAVIPITTFTCWWKDRAEYSIRKAVNRAHKLGIIVRPTDFTDEFVEAALAIYNETPVRQGKLFWHFGKTFQAIKDALATYAERSLFIGAYYQEELIGFIKLTSVGATATITQILSAKRHFDKRPNNALLAKAIEVCESRGWSDLIYGSFVYYDPNSTLTEFKRRNGFEPAALPRYYIPLTMKGKVVLRSGLQHGFAGVVPRRALTEFLKIRRYWYLHRYKRMDSEPSA